MHPRFPVQASAAAARTQEPRESIDRAGKMVATPKGSPAASCKEPIPGLTLPTNTFTFINV